MMEFDCGVCFEEVVVVGNVVDREDTGRECVGVVGDDSGEGFCRARRKLRSAEGLSGNSNLNNLSFFGSLAPPTIYLI